MNSCRGFSGILTILSTSYTQINWRMCLAIHVLVKFISNYSMVTSENVLLHELYVPYNVFIVVIFTNVHVHENSNALKNSQNIAYKNQQRLIEPGDSKCVDRRGHSKQRLLQSSFRTLGCKIQHFQFTFLLMISHRWRVD